ncbi:molybdenum cofactor guanylyltransferase [Actinobacillus succinogenes]|uniref:Molybdenum cofactor guanylyltransferase n=1 Tax=Actinobacillus succinogenes (strain ATCC 55618 / DSM 22257 / CCUG 43843 / 130Z) TaxID=339671 RepID=A6VL41_ACTSZ|nr:molybdenum cofactor guanylyltransferase MobA [Actinobacillus succinogenes]ABR73688.1 molybdopterin-guanine dinucleotide biosynthesis protein A [Actinobacillus succinogenes 130Z]PHI39853.1 molybdenum cofactor guanylyltransferase [Actinobacillus succinogenes]
MITISAVILAGGLARRMNGADKGLQKFHGKPLIQHVIERLQPQISTILINANRNLTDYKKFGLPIFSDELADYQGPLSGMLTGLKKAQTDYVLFVPCDCPFLPLNLVEKLKSAVEKSDVFAAYATDGERAHPTFCLISRQLLTALSEYLVRGERRMLHFLNNRRAVAVDFSQQKSAFRNFNTLEELQSP